MAQREIKFRAWFAPFKGKKVFQGYKYGKAGALLTFADMSPEQYEIEQYTGLKNKNGVEIYEGDIVVDTDILEISEIKVMDGAWMLVNTHDLLADYATDVKVIGNIHENPELLEAE